MANGIDAVVEALQDQTHNLQNGLGALSNDIGLNLDQGIRDLQESISSDVRDLQEAVENSQESEEDKAEAKISQKKQLGVLGTIAAGILAIPNQIVKETKGEGILGGILGNELVQTGLGIADKFLAPVKAVLGKTADIAAPLVKKAGKFGLVAAGVFAAVEGIKGAFEGVKRAGEIFGVEQEQATMSQKISAGIGGFVEGIANAPATLLEMIGMGELAKKWRTFIDQFDITERIALSIEPTIAKITKFFEPLGPIFEKLGNFVKDKIAPHVMEALEGIGDFFTNIVGGVFKKIREVGIFQKIETLILTISDVVGSVFTSIIDSGILPKLKTFFEEVFIGFYNTFVERIGLVLDKLNEAFVAAKPAIDKVVQILTGIVEFLMPIVKTITTGVLFPAITKVFGILMDVLTFVGQGLMMVINPIVDFIAKFFPEGGSGPEDLGNKFANGIQLVFDTIFGFIDNVTDWMKTNLTWENIIQGVKDFSVFIVDKFSEIWSDATHKLGDAIESVKKSLILFIRKIPLLSEFGMTDEEKVVKQQTDNINKLTKGKKPKIDTIKETFESADPRMLSAIIEGGRLNAQAMQILDQVIRERRENQQRATEITANQFISRPTTNLNAPTNIIPDASTVNSNHQGSMVTSGG